MALGRYHAVLVLNESIQTTEEIFLEQKGRLINIPCKMYSGVALLLDKLFQHIETAISKKKEKKFKYRLSLTSTQVLYILSHWAKSQPNYTGTQNHDHCRTAKPQE